MVTQAVVGTIAQQYLDYLQNTITQQEGDNCGAYSVDIVPLSAVDTVPAFVEIQTQGLDQDPFGRTFPDTITLGQTTMADVGLYYLLVRYFQDLNIQDQGFYGPDHTAIPSITQELIVQVDPCKLDRLILSP